MIRKRMRNLLARVCSRPAFAIATAAVVVGAVSSLTVAVPAAHADPLADIRGRVNGARSGSTCPALNYSVALEGEAQALTGNTLPGVPPTGQYTAVGHFVSFTGDGDPAQTAEVHAEVKADAAIHDCQYKDFGVGFFRVNDSDRVAIVLGVPNAPAPVQQQQPQPQAQTITCPPNSASPTVPAGQQCQAAAPIQCPPNSAAPTVPAGQQCAAPTNTVQMSITRNILVANVSLTNTGPLGGTCAYKATMVGLGIGPAEVDQSVDIAANGKASYPPMPWPPPGTTYQAVVTCTGQWNGTTVTFGSASQPVTG